MSGIYVSPTIYPDTTQCRQTAFSDMHSTQDIRCSHLAYTLYKAIKNLSQVEVTSLQLSAGLKGDSLHAFPANVRTFSLPPFLDFFFSPLLYLLYLSVPPIPDEKHTAAVNLIPDGFFQFGQTPGFTVTP